MEKTRVAILGAGPAGLGAAYRLRHLDRAHVTVLEQQGVVGGNAGSFEFGGQRLDYGSHRLHPACDSAILTDIRRFLGADLLDRPRHGRILLRGRWIHFPLKPLDLLLRLDPAFALGSAKDMLLKALRAKRPRDSFASSLHYRLGPTICDNFYFPYARKIWGREPEALSAIQAERRVSAGSFSKLFKKILSQIPGLKPSGGGRFFYPRRGYGQISEAYADAARQAGADILLNTRVTRLNPPDREGGAWRIELERDGSPSVIDCDYVWSTIPITILRRLTVQDAETSVPQAANAIEYRAMLLIYLNLDVDQFTEYDAHYFPAASIRITRLSEPKNYADLSEPIGSTTLCAELPCDVGDRWWAMADDDLAQLVADDLRRAGIPLPHSPRAVHVRRLGQAYPIYAKGYERSFDTLDHWADRLPHLLTFGRQGLFAHDNTHHALFMGYRAAECLSNGSFDAEKWRAYREIFKTHVVED